MTFRAMRFVCLVAALLVAGCEKPKEAPPLEARFGIFFGGQVQEREELPLVLDRTRQSHGIRLDFREPPERALRVAWELEKPSTEKLEDGGKLVEYGETRTRVGESRLEIPLAFRANDRPGAWRLRVTVDERVVLEKAFRVVPPGPAPKPIEE